MKKEIDAININHVYTYCTHDRRGECVYVCKVEGYDEFLKGRSEVLIMRTKEGKLQVFISKEKAEVCCMNNSANISYAVPGGGWIENDNHEGTVCQEAKEEAYIIIKNPYYCNSYIEMMGKNLSKGAKGMSHHYQYKGYYTEVYVAEFDQYYNGYINERERDERIRKGKFYDVDKIINDLRREHQDAINNYRRKNNI